MIEDNIVNKLNLNGKFGNKSTVQDSTIINQAFNQYFSKIDSEG
jgi:hypothetical protein